MCVLQFTFLTEAASSHCEKWTRRFPENSNGWVLKPTAIRFSCSSSRGHVAGFLSMWQTETVLRGVAVHTEPLLTLAQSALCHRINQKSWPQVAHRSHSHTMVSGWNSGCAHHMPCLQRGNQSPGLSRLPVPPPLSLGAHCTMPPTQH